MPGAVLSGEISAKAYYISILMKTQMETGLGKSLETTLDVRLVFQRTAVASALITGSGVDCLQRR